MTAMEGTYVHRDLHLFEMTIGEALADLVRQRYPRDTAKHIARAWDIDASTAANVVRGHCSIQTLKKAWAAESWPLIKALGAVITGETDAEHEERKLQQIIREGEHARENLRRLQSRREALEQGASDAVHAFDRALANEARSGERRTWRASDQPSNRPAGKASDHKT